MSGEARPESIIRAEKGNWEEVLKQVPSAP